MRRHSHRHRPASRHPTRLQRVASATFLLIGFGVLIGLCFLTRTGRVLLMCSAAVPALWALLRLSYFAGRTAAHVRNSLALESGRVGLERIMRTARDTPSTP